MAVSLNHPGIYGFRVRRGTSFLAALGGTLAKFAASKLTVSPGILCFEIAHDQVGELLTSVGVR